VERRWISVSACSTYLNLHKKSIYRLIYRGQIPAAKIGRSVRIDLKKLNETLESQTK